MRSCAGEDSLCWWGWMVKCPGKAQHSDQKGPQWSVLTPLGRLNFLPVDTSHLNIELERNTRCVLCTQSCVVLTTQTSHPTIIWDDTSSDVTQYYSMGTVKGWENEKYLSSKISTIEIQSEWNVQYLPGNMLLCSLRLLTSNWGNCPLLLWRGESGTKRSIKWSIMTLIIKLLHYIATHSQLYANFRGGRNSGWSLLW